MVRRPLHGRACAPPPRVHRGPRVVAAMVQKPFLQGPLASAMRILVTGAANPYGAAVCRALADLGHTVRAFGIAPGEDPFHHPQVEPFAGDLAVGGSVEPVAAECQALVHCAAFDDAVPGGQSQSFHVERGTLYARYAAERELVAQFIAVMPSAAPRGLGAAVKQAETHVQGTRKLVPHVLLHVATPEEAARQVAASIARLPVAA